MNHLHSPPPLIQVVGYSGSGKTTLLSRVVKRLTRQGWSVGTIKHHPKSWEWDEPGKDTWRHRRAGANPVALVTGDRTVVDLARVREPAELLPFYRGMDVVLVEGFKQAPHPKLVLVHREEDRSLLELSSILTLVSSQPEQWKKWGPCLDWDDVEKAAAVIARKAGLAFN